MAGDAIVAEVRALRAAVGALADRPAQFTGNIVSPDKQTPRHVRRRGDPAQQPPRRCGVTLYLGPAGNLLAFPSPARDMQRDPVANIAQKTTLGGVNRTQRLGKTSRCLQGVLGVDGRIRLQRARRPDVRRVRTRVHDPHGPG
jgi:hypothetical protein